MGGAGSCLQQLEGHINTGGMGTLSGTRMPPGQYALLSQSVEELSAIKDGAQRVGVIAFKRLFVSMPDTFAIFEFQDDDW